MKGPSIQDMRTKKKQWRVNRKPKILEILNLKNFIDFTFFWSIFVNFFCIPPPWKIDVTDKITSIVTTFFSWRMNIEKWNFKNLGTKMSFQFLKTRTPKAPLNTTLVIATDEFFLRNNIFLFIRSLIIERGVGEVSKSNTSLRAWVCIKWASWYDLYF